MYIVYSDKYKEHYSSMHHVENPDRLTRALSSLRGEKIVEPIKVEDPQIVHSEDYVEKIRNIKGEKWIDADTYANDKTYETALYALGGALKAFELQGFALVRPPGHHAGKNGRAFNAPTLGFCIFNNVAYVVRKKALKHVAIIDFDVHYGNGTQEIFYDDPEVLHIDIHQDPKTIFPGTGFPEMVGKGEAEGTKVNLLIPPRGSDDLYEELFPLIQSILEDFKPAYIIFSAGFDGFKGDGLASLNLTEYTFYNLGSLGKGKYSAGVLEGGYGVGLERGLPAFIKGLKGEIADYAKEKSPDSVKSRFFDYLEKEKEILRNYWKI
ncbi:MAG: histone deacetylase family protein [Acidianus infernus]|nr:histone deacetylase family protein [Acidianus infernus]